MLFVIAALGLLCAGCADRTIGERLPPPMVVYANGVRYVTDQQGVSHPEPIPGAPLGTLTVAEDARPPAPETGPSVQTR